MKNQTPDLCLFGGTAVTMNAKGDIIENSLIQIKSGRIQSITSATEAPKGVKVIDTSQCLVTPGFVNGHTHVGMSLLRGLGDDLPFQEWLLNRIFPLEKKWMSSEFVYWGALLSTLEMIRSGTTVFNDMYYFQDDIAKGISESGMRAICAQAIVDISGVQESKEILDGFDALMDKLSPYHRVMLAIGPHSVYGVQEKVWPKIVEYAKEKNMLIHVHLQEMQDETDSCLKTRGKTPTEFLDDVGLWQHRSLAAHSVCLTENDIQILGKRKVGISHNPGSNFKLGTKICPVIALRKAGARVALGTDSVASNNNLDMLQEADMAAKLQAYVHGAGVLKAEEVVKMLTIEGASALGLQSDIGSLEVGKAADMIALDISGPHAAPFSNAYSHLVYSASAHDVKHSVVGGTVLMQDKKIQTLDEAAILAEVRRWGKKIQAS